MKLKEYNQDSDLVILAEYDDPYNNKYYFLLDEATNEISFATKSSSAIKGFKEFLHQHPFMTAVAVSVGLSALDAYKSNKRMTTRFFATNIIEKEMYRNIVDELSKTGNYTILKRAKRINNGWLWELKRKG
jgi:hypothetical protein